MRVLRFHVLPPPHASTSLKYIMCAFTMKVLKWLTMMFPTEHETYHYGCESSDVECTEHVTVTTEADLRAAVQWHVEKKGLDPNYNPIRDGFIFDRQDPVNIAFANNAAAEIRKRYQPDDFLLCFWGCGAIPVVSQLNDLNDLHVVEPGIGYPMTFSKYRIFESQAKLHLVRGQEDERYENKIAGNAPYTMPLWFDTVIPNYWDPEKFKSRAEKDGSLFFIARIMKTKGLEIATKLAEVSGRKLNIAGQGNVEQALGYKPACDYEFLGVVDQQTRNDFMKKAEVGLTPSLYIEPFCGTHAEFWFNERGILTTPWGVFSETVIDGYNGYKCSAFSGGNEEDPSFVWGLENISRINPKDCYDYAVKKFSLAAVRNQYINYFQRLLNYHEALRSDKHPFFF